MKKMILPLLIGAMALNGCVHPYVVKLSNGRQITVAHKPKLKNGAYQYKDSSGKLMVIPASHVREIEPASMAQEEQHQFQPAQPPKKRHWYLLWIA
jgi:hypothetical protein